MLCKLINWYIHANYFMNTCWLMYPYCKDLLIDFVWKEKDGGNNECGKKHKGNLEKMRGENEA